VQRPDPRPQDLCKGIADIARELKGPLCVELDVERHSVVPSGTAKDIHDLIEEEVRMLGSPQGSLMIIVGTCPRPPPPT
jgi:hypothetical protein